MKAETTINRPKSACLTTQMPSPVPLPKYLRRVMVSFRILPAILTKFQKHVPKRFRSQWLERAVTEKLRREGVEVEEKTDDGE